MNNEIRELSMDELDRVSGGNITVVADKDYVGIEISIGGYGFAGTMGFFTGVMHIPALFAFLAIAAEFFGGLGLIFGFLTRIAAFGIFSNMVVAVAMVRRHFGFFVNWTGAQKGEGYEYHLLVLAITTFLMIRGAGAASVDRMLSLRIRDETRVQVA